MASTERDSEKAARTQEIESESVCDNADFEKSFTSPEKQEARAILRERFLRAITGLVGKQAVFHLYENTKVNAEFRGCDVDFMELYVRNLKTPLGTIPEAILRSSDVIHVDFGLK